MPIWQNSGIQRFELKKACLSAGFFGIGTKKRRAGDTRSSVMLFCPASLCLQNGDDVKTVQSNLGHATASFTLDVYGHVSEKMKQDSANRTETYMRGTVYGKAQNG